MQGIEKALDDAFKKAPQMPESGRKMLASFMPWLALLGALVALVSAWNIYRIATVADQYLNGIYSTFGYTSPIVGATATVWAGMAILILEAVFLLVAFPALRTYKKSGWNLLFWADLATIAYTIITDFFGGYVNIGEFIVYLLGVAIGMYLLFQIRPIYTGAMPHPVAPVAPKTTHTPEATQKK